MPAIKHVEYHGHDNDLLCGVTIFFCLLPMSKRDAGSLPGRQYYCHHPKVVFNWLIDRLALKKM
jgi:hypothetical protein